MQAEIRLQQGITKLGLNVTVEVQEKLIAYLQLMLKWNRAYNLTAIRELDAMVIRHLLDSLSILPYIDQSPVLDVGTGAGLPGIPLALCLPDTRFVLLDSNGKKTRFLTQVKIELGIENIEIIHSNFKWQCLVFILFVILICYVEYGRFENSPTPHLICYSQRRHMLYGFLVFSPFTHIKP